MEFVESPNDIAFDKITSLYQSVGKQLAQHCLKRFNHVRTHMILTDDEARQHSLYQSLGFKNTKSLKQTPLNAFIKLLDTDLN